MGDFPAIGETGKQPERADRDGPVRIQKTGDQLCITCEQDGVQTQLICSAHNAWRVFGLLSFFLGAKLSQKVMKGIML